MGVTSEQIAELLGDWGYLTYFLLLVATGIGSPLPEDLLLAAAGYLVSANVFSWAGAVMLGMLGVVSSDALLYTWGRRLRANASNGSMSRLVSPRHFAAVERWLGRFGDKAVFFGRLLPGTRTVAFIGAGMRGMPLRRFLLFDGAGALIWVPAVVFAGAQLGEEIGGLDQLRATVTRFAMWLIVLIIVLIALASWWRAEASKL